MSYMIMNEKTCRICLQNNGEIDIFKEETDESESFSYKFSSCTSMKISVKDFMPKLLCELCAHKLNDAYSLWKLAHKSNAMLRKKFDIVKHKVERVVNFDCTDDFKSDGSEKSATERISLPMSKDKSKFIHDHHAKVIKKKVEILNAQNRTQFTEDMVKLNKMAKDADEKIYRKKSKTLSQLKERYIKKKIRTQESNFKKLKRNNPVICEECGRKCKTMKILHVHKRVHREDKPYNCSFCDWKFTWKGNRDMHVSTVHLRNKKYQCELCPKQFAYHKNLIEHRRIHTGEKPHVCDKCNRSFSRRFAMIRHGLTHTQARPYGCIHCHKTYTQCNDLKAHVKKSHVDTPTKTLSDYCLKLN